MKILYIITYKEKEKLSKKTIDSIKQNLKAEDQYLSVLFNDIEEKQNYYSIFEEEVAKQFTHICLIPNNSYLESNFKELITEYLLENLEKHTIYLPFALLSTNENINGLLNTSLWSQHAMEIGKLDHELSLMQSDTILFGALIPVELFLEKSNYKDDLRFYQHYYLLNKWTANENIAVIGIPKIGINITYDLSFGNIDKEIKIENYKKAREEWISNSNVVTFESK